MLHRSICCTCEGAFPQKDGLTRRRRRNFGPPTGRDIHSGLALEAIERRRRQPFLIFGWPPSVGIRHIVNVMVSARNKSHGLNVYDVRVMNTARDLRPRLAVLT
jgi:hypothetical protein